MELACDLNSIKSEELLRKMWQQSEDVNRKKEIRSHLFKLRESRLRDLYQNEIMSGSSAPGFGKDPLTPCHGDSLVDQSFQSLKSKEIRDSISPSHDMKFHTTTLNHPNSTGWDVQTSSEVSPDGRAYRSETKATTDGVEKINGGLAEFQGRNEQRSSGSYQGDDKNFVKKAAESANTHLQEKVVTGDANSGRTEMKMSSTTSSSSSQVVSSSSTTENVDNNKYLMDNPSRNYDQHQQHLQQQQQQHHQQQQRHQEQEYQERLQEERFRKETQQQYDSEENKRISDRNTTQQRQQQFTEEYNRNREESSNTTNVETENVYEKTQRRIDVEKTSPEYQQHVQYLMAQPGEIISNTVEYPKPNVKMITTVKRLPDGTIVRNKRYETEELQPSSGNTRQRNTSSTNQSNTQRKTDRQVHNEENTHARQQNLRDSKHSDAVDNVETVRHISDRNTNINNDKKHLIESHPTTHHTGETNISSSSVKKSSQHFSTESTSETIEEYEDRSPSHVPGSRGKPSGRAPQDFTTHGFPSVRPNKQTQEYATERPHAARPSDDFTTHGFPSVRPDKPTQEYPTDRLQAVRSNELQHTKERNVTDSKKHSSDFTTHGFPSVRPSAKEEVVVVSSESSRSAKYNINSERVIETEVVTDVDYPSYGSPHPVKPSHRPTEDFTTHGFPSVRSNIPTQEYPSGRPQPARSNDTQHNTERNVTESKRQTSDFTTHGFPSVKPTSTTNEDVTVVSSETRLSSKHNSNTERVIETEVVTDGNYPSTTTQSPQKIGYAPEHSGRSPNKSTPDFSTHGFPSTREITKPNSPYTQTPTGRKEDVVIVSSETSHNAKFQTNSEHVYESETFEGGNYKKQDFTTHGFPSVRESTPIRGGSPRPTQVKEYPSSPRRSQPSEDFTTHGFPSVRSPTKPTSDFSTQGFPSVRSPTKPTSDFSTQGFPSVRSPTKTTTDFSTQGFPSVRDITKSTTKLTHSTPQPKPQPQVSTTKKTTTTETTSKVAQKQKEVDAAHRAFAASLRSSSPVDNTRRDGYPDHQRQTPRSSVSSTKTFRRDLREGSHESGAPSDTSRVSSSTVTRQSPSKSVGKTVVTKQTIVKTKNVKGSNETIDLTPQRSTKSPSPGKTVTTTTSRTTTTRKTPTSDVPKSDNQITKPAAKSFPINEPLTIKKTQISSNDASFSGNAVVEEPCIQKHYYQLGPSDKTSKNSDDRAKIDYSPQSESKKIITNMDSKDKKTTTTKNTNAVTAPTDRHVQTEVPSTRTPSETSTPTVATENPIENPLKKKVTYAIDKDNEKLHEKSPHSPAPTTHKTSTHPKNKPQLRNDKPDRYDEPINEPSSSSDIEPNDRNGMPIKPHINNAPYTGYPKESSVDRRTVARETTFENTTQSKNRLNEVEYQPHIRVTEPQYFDDSVNSSDVEPNERNQYPSKPFINQTHIPSSTDDQTKPIFSDTQSTPDTHDYPKNRVPAKTPINKEPIRQTFAPISNDENNRTEKLFQQTHQTHQTKKTKNFNDEFITTEREHQHPHYNETPDGGLISKDHEPTPTSPTFKKKGLTNRETFEERCRHILGMENDGDTQGVYKNHTVESVTSEKPKEYEPFVQQPKGVYDTQFEVRIEDCDDDEPLYISNVKESLQIRKETVVPKSTIPVQPTRESGSSTPTMPRKPQNVYEKKPVTLNARKSMSPEPRPAALSPRKSMSPEPRPAALSPRKSMSPEPRPVALSPRKSVSPETKRVPLNPLKSVSTEPKRVPLNPRKSVSPEPTRAPLNTRKSMSPEPKPKKTLPEPSHVSETESVDYEFEIDTEKENYISEKVINCNKKILVEDLISPSSPEPKRSPRTPNRQSPQPYTGVPGRKLSPSEISPKRGPNVVKRVPAELPDQCYTPKPSKPLDKSPVPSKTIAKTPRRSVTKADDTNVETLDKRQTKISKTSTVKSTAKHIISDKEEIHANKTAQHVTTKQPKKETPTKSVRKTSEILEKSVESLPRSRKPAPESPTSTIKNRLRSSTSKHTSRTHVVDGKSSPETSPTRGTERRRSSNISVHTEIIIDHAGPKSPKLNEPHSRRQPQSQKPSSVTPDKFTRKLPVTERKESAPVHRVTRKDKDVKMSRSTSENVIKVTGKPVNKNVMSSLSPGSTTKPDRRPSKCFTTKTINLTTTDTKNTMNSNDMENIIIDIQQAKSSREPSPDKIVPTPVPIDLDTGKPRYPDVVQEPEDEPRKKPIVKNIPIYEEDSNDYVGCQISEVTVEKSTKLGDYIDYHDNPTIEAPISLDYQPSDKPDDECLLSVHEKVSKFTHTAEEVKKPKASSPFNRHFDETCKVPENDDCLLTVDQKVNKFLKTAESITKHPITPLNEIERPNFSDLDEELLEDECTLSVSEKVNKFVNTADKLSPSAPQKSPELVARMERHISRQSEPEYFDQSTDDEPLAPFSENHTNEIEIKRQKDILSRSSVWENRKDHENQNKYHTTKKTTSKTTEIIDDEYLEPMTKSHTTSIELKRQKDILSRPSTLDKSKVPDHQKKPHTPISRKSKITEKAQLFENTNKSSTEKTNIHSTNRTKSITAAPKPRKDVPSDTKKVDDHKGPTKYHTSTISTTRSRFESPSPDNRGPKRAPSTEPATHTKTHPRTQQQRVLHTRKTSADQEEYRTRKVENREEHFTTDTESEITSTSYRTSPIKTNEYSYSDEENVLSVKDKQIHKHTSPKDVSHSPVNPSNKSTKTTITKITERTSKHTSPSRTRDTDSVEPILEEPKSTKSPTIPIGKTRVPTDTVAARRNIFEKDITSNPQQPSSPVQNGRRPTYMDHTMSSLEHTRRDSLEINKTNYSRKSSLEEETQIERRPNTSVKFDVPQKQQKEPSEYEDIDIEEIFDLEVLEEMLEVVTSYEVRRRIRAQIRLVKKNNLNTQLVDKKKSETNTSTTISSTHKSSTYSSKEHHEETDAFSDVKQTKKQNFSSHSPSRTTKPQHEETVIYEGKSTKQPRDRSHSPEPSKVFGAGKPIKNPRERSHSPETFVCSAGKPTRVPLGRNQSPETIVFTVGKPTKKPHDRSPSPDEKTFSSSLKEVRRESGPQTQTSKHYTRTEHVDYSTELRRSPQADRKQSSETTVIHRIENGTHKPDSKPRLPNERSQSPDYQTRPTAYKRSKSPDSKPKSRPTEYVRGKSPEGKSYAQPRDRSHSPQFKTKNQREEVHSVVAKTTVRTSPSPERKPSRPKADDKTPIWADRKNVLKNQGTTTKNTQLSASKTVKSSSQRQSKTTEEDSITSSYGIGPTDENGLPLFGIRALKKKKQTQPCDTTEEVTGYVVEEKYYSDNKSKPVVERKEYIYSTNADELEQIKNKVQNRKISNDDGVTRKFQKIDKEYIHSEPRSIMPSSEEFSTSSRKYVRRGSVKEMSEKLIRKESSQSVTEKSSAYPKAGLILRTNSRLGAADGGDCFELSSENYTKTGHRTDEETDEESEVEMRRSSRTVTEHESESESMNIQREVSKQSTTSTRSFLNSTGESRIVSGVDDVLERMRNADNVVEEGDTAEDQEARSLLNKFLGASVIMRGVETASPTTLTKTTTSYTNRDGGNLGKQEFKTTRVTKTTKSGSSSSPVTRTTCDIEEIWDEEILKALLEKATTYEERRKIRARLRELMAEREEKKNSKAGEKAVLTTAEPQVEEEEEEEEEDEEDCSSSEYEEIIEEVTDYSDAEEEEEVVEEKKPKSPVSKAKAVDTTEIKKKTEQLVVATATEKVTELKTKDEKKVVTQSKVVAEQVASQKAETKQTETAANTEKGESLIPFLQDLLHKNKPQAKTANQNSSTPSANSNKNIQISKTSTNKPCTAGNNAVNSSNKSSKLNVSNTTTTNKTNTDTDTKTNTNTNTNSSTKTNSNSKDPNQKPLLPSTGTMTKTKDDKTTNNVVSSVSSITKPMKNLSVPQKEDSGTESGEDLRLIAAGLCDKLHIHNGTNLIEEVTSALNRLESSLKEGKDISVDNAKRQALLALVARLQTGLTSPEKLAEAAMAASEMENNDVNCEETSSPEAEGQRTNRSRFAKRRNRNNRHTVGVSREELADARRYMEDMLIMENFSNSTTPDSSVNTMMAPQWFPIEKNASSGAILANNQPVQLFRPYEFVPSNIKNSTECLRSEPGNSLKPEKAYNPTNSRPRPLSGDYSVTFEQPKLTTYNGESQLRDEAVESNRTNLNASPDSALKGNRFMNKKQLMKRANTIDIPKTKRYNPEFDTDSEKEDRGPFLGLKRTVQANAKHRARNVLPPFEPKTENDHKFLAFINKQTAKPGLGWNGSRSVSNWTNKFGSIKHTFEVGAAATTTTGKPPQVPGHVPQNSAKNYWNKQVAQHPDYTQLYNSNNNLQLQRSPHEAAERQRRLEKERYERERIEKDRLERQRQERERMERDRLEREFYEREQLERERLAAAQHAAMPSMNVPIPVPVNQFIHAPQSVFRPIDNNELYTKPIYKPIPQMPNKPNTWQPPTAVNKAISNVQVASSPQYLATKQALDNSYITSPSPTTSSPVGLPWLSKPTVNNSDFKSKANKFEERSLYDNRNSSYLQRHNSLRAPKTYHQPIEDPRKRPSLPNAADPYLAMHSQYIPQEVYASTERYEPTQPPNVPFIYNNYSPRGNYQSYPCLPSAVDAPLGYDLRHEDSLTNPQAMPLVLTSANPSYGPQTSTLQSSNIIPAPKFDYVDPVDSAATSPSIMTMAQTDYTDDDLDSDTNMLEYRVQSKVMGKPLSQTAVTVGRRTAHMSDDEVFGKNSRAAKSLLHTMKTIGGGPNNGSKQERNVTKRPEAATSPKVCLSPDGRSYQAPLVEPLFPQITSFEPNRSPLYINQNATKPTAVQKQSVPTQALPKPQITERAPQAYTQSYPEQAPYITNPLPGVQQAMPVRSNMVPYVSETQTSYVVTYPSEDAAVPPENMLRKPHPTSLPIQRHRNISENSTASSSISNNIPSPSTNWTSNPVHVDNSPVTMPRKVYAQLEETTTHSNQYQSQQYLANSMQPETRPMMSNAVLERPEVAQKPQLPPLNMTPQQTTAPQYNQVPAHQQITPQEHKVVAPQYIAPKLQQAQEPLQHLPQKQYQPPAVVERPKLRRMQTLPSTSQPFEPQYQPSQAPISKQSSAVAGTTALQTQNRVVSQQSLITRQQQQQPQQQQQHEFQQQITEMRRKSLGHVLEIQQQQRKSAYFETQNEVKQEYKSSAPADTPDIVKSSLPKDENAPILKKFGPPQRHHYVPNAYQSPQTNSQTQTKKFTSTSSTSVVKTTKREVVQHTNVTTKPSIMETPATPQPTEDMIPRNIVFNNISAFTSMSRRQDDERAVESQTRPNRLKQHASSTTEKTETKEKDGAIVTTTTKVTTRTVSGTGTKPVSPFAKFKQLDKQNSLQSSKSPSTPTTLGVGTASPSGSAPIFRFTDPALNARAATVKDQLLQWCQIKTKEYENVQITNFSSSWVDGLAFCALIHHFLPDAFDYSQLTQQSRRHNFELAFTVADEKAGIAPLLDVEDMVEMKRPDWKCVFVYVQSIYRRFRNCQ